MQRCEKIIPVAEVLEKRIEPEYINLSGRELTKMWKRLIKIPTQEEIEGNPALDTEITDNEDCMDCMGGKISLYSWVRIMHYNTIL